MGEFDKVRRAFQEHQNNIYDKLVEIMSGRALAGTKKLKALDWEEGASNGTNEYMETLVKETTTLHRNLTKHLPESTVRMIMLPVFKNYKDTFGAAYQGVELKTEQGRERYVLARSGVAHGLFYPKRYIMLTTTVRMLRDVDFFQSHLGKIDGFEDAGDYLVSVIKSKQISAPPPPPTPPPAPAPQPASSKTAITTPPPPSRSPSPAAPAPASATSGGEEGKPSAEWPTVEPQAPQGDTQENGDSNGASPA
jgi:vacuolar protein sorting-associated protein 54